MHCDTNKFAAKKQIPQNEQKLKQGRLGGTKGHDYLTEQMKPLWDEVWTTK